MSVLPAAGAISFARGIPSPDLLPVEQLAEASRRAIERHGRVALNYGPPAGFGPLREWIAARHGVATERVVVTPGSLIGLGFLIRHLLAGGGRALVDSPTYDRTLHLLRAAGAEAVTEPPARLAYVMPTFHNPTGRTMTLREREELADRDRRARADGDRGRPVRPAAVRRRAAAVPAPAAARPRRGRARRADVARSPRASRPGCGSATSCSPRRWWRRSRRSPRRPTCRRRCSPRRSCTSSSPPVSSSRTSRTCGRRCGRGATRCSRCWTPS